MIYDERAFRVQTNTARHHNKIQHHIRIFSILTFWLVVLLLLCRSVNGISGWCWEKQRITIFLADILGFPKVFFIFWKYKNFAPLFWWQEQHIIDRIRSVSFNSVTSSTMNFISSVLESNPGLRDEMPAIKRLTRGTTLTFAFYRTYTLIFSS
jgi:hypothetical protein